MYFYVKIDSPFKESIMGAFISTKCYPCFKETIKCPFPVLLLEEMEIQFASKYSGEDKISRCNLRLHILSSESFAVYMP